MHQEETRYLLALSAINGIGKITAHKLLNHFGTAKNVFEASSAQLNDFKLKPQIVEQLEKFDFASLDPILAWADQPNRHIISYGSPFYPPLLSQIYDPPLYLFLLGDPELLITPQIAVVGSRNPTITGINNAKMLCESLVDQHLTITSGLAAGIDGEAHRAALAANGRTIAVCGTGLNRVYPAHHRDLAHLIAQQGALVSELLPDEKQSAGSFPSRNRIIAGLSLGTLVIEAAEKSGTLLTARHSMEAGREVFAVPGSIHSPLSRGCHGLIKQGAKLTESVNDILDDLPHFDRTFIDRSAADERKTLDSESAEFLKHVDYEVTSLDTIVTRSQLTVEAVTNKLLTLELQGWVVNSVGGFIRQ